MSTSTNTALESTAHALCNLTSDSNTRSVGMGQGIMQALVQLCSRLASVKTTTQATTGSASVADANSGGGRGGGRGGGGDIGRAVVHVAHAMCNLVMDTDTVPVHDLGDGHGGGHGQASSTSGGHGSSHTTSSSSSSSHRLLFIQQGGAHGLGHLAAECEDPTVIELVTTALISLCLDETSGAGVLLVSHAGACSFPTSRKSAI